MMTVIMMMMTISDEKGRWRCKYTAIYHQAKRDSNKDDLTQMRLITLFADGKFQNISVRNRKCQMSNIATSIVFRKDLAYIIP